MLQNIGHLNPIANIIIVMSAKVNSASPLRHSKKGLKLKKTGVLQVNAETSVCMFKRSFEQHSFEQGN